MTIPPETPVLVGAGQVSQRVEPGAALEPVDLAALAARAAEDDAGARRPLLPDADTVAFVETLSWRYPDPAASLARRLGITPRDTWRSTTGGNSPQLLLTQLADSVRRGERGIVVVAGAECVYTRWRARREPRVHLEWSEDPDPPCATVVGDDRPGNDDYEMAHLAMLPTQVYPLFETALRHRTGRSVAEHQIAISELWSHFAAVAASNPHAWSRDAWTAEEIRTPSPENRMVVFPYTKRMVANIDVDQAAALVLCSYEAARSHGVPDDRLVFVWAGADAHDHPWFSSRWSLAESPAIAALGTALLDAAGIDLDAVARFDLYSCFPSAVEIALAELGLSGPAGGDDRPLTVTGGLPFAGGPGNNYPSHSIAAMVEACRADPGSIGLVTGVGWYLTKHSMGLYGSDPPPGGFRRVPVASVQPALDAAPSRDRAAGYEGPATVEATAVVMERDGTPSVGLLSALLPDGRRALAHSRQPDELAALCERAWEGATVRLRTDTQTGGDTFQLFQ